MTDTEKKSMEQCAIEHRDSMVAEVRLVGLLQQANDCDDIEPDEWVEIEKQLDLIVSCDNCGEAPSVHEETDDGFMCRGEEAEGDTFSIRSLHALREEAEEAIQQWNYGAGISMTVDVTLYGGGPAGGVEFDVEKGRYGLEMLGARVWHQDWFEPKGYAPLDDDTASRLFNLWGLEYMMEGQ